MRFCETAKNKTGKLPVPLQGLNNQLQQRRACGIVRKLEDYRSTSDCMNLKSTQDATPVVCHFHIHYPFKGLHSSLLHHYTIPATNLSWYTTIVSSTG